LHKPLSWWQSLFALIFGVCLGLVVSSFLYADRSAFVKRATGSMNQATTAISSAISNVKVMPSLEQRMTILLMGVDSNGFNCERWVGTRSDTMMLVSCDPILKRVGCVSIPRDSRVRIIGHGNDKINSAHALGGPELAVETVRQSFSVPVDHYMVIDTQGLRKVFEALGPIEVKVEKRMRYTDHAGKLHVALDPGLQTLTPVQAEEYVRFRHDARGDIGRIDRQQWFMRQVSKKLREPQVVLKLPELFKLANQYVVTDLSVEDMARLATFGKDIQSNQVQTATLPGEAQTIHGGSYWIPNEKAGSIVFNRLLGTPLEPNYGPQIAGSANSAVAAENPSGNKPLSFIVRYPKGAENIANAFEKELTSKGYVVKYRTKGDAAECAHEELMQCSYRADDIATQQLRQNMNNVSQFPVIVAVEDRPAADFVLVIANDTVCPVIEQSKEASSDPVAVLH